jgi:hypothetical protein
MKNKDELINILKAELILLSQEIIRDVHKKDIKNIYKSSRKLYEKTNAVYQLSKLVGNKQAVEILLGNDENTIEQKPKIDSTFQKNEETEHKNHSEEPVMNGNEPEEETNKADFRKDSIYKSVNNMKFVPKEEKKKEETGITEEFKKMNIGLNDKIAFIRHLFNNNSTAYNTVIEKLNAFDSYEKALNYIHKEVKPQYNHWEGKDEYEFRLIQLLELKFNK